MHLADIPDATRTVEYLFADAVGCLSRDRELLADARTAPEGSALRRHLADAKCNFRQSQGHMAELLSKLTELERAVSRYLPDVAPELRVVGTGKEADDVDAVIRELRLIRSAAIRAAAPPEKVGTKKRKRRRSSPEKLTDIQRKTLEVVGDCKGNINKAAKRLNRDRSTVNQAYKAALRKLGKQPVKYGTKTFVRDRRGQDDVADIDDQRRDSDEDQRRRFRRR